MTEISDGVQNRSGGALQRGVSEAIARAARDELAEQGFARFSVERAARRAGVGKAAVYRRWESKDAMLRWLLAGAGVDYAKAPDAGSLRGDLEAYVRSSADILADPTTARIAGHLYGELSTDSAYAALIRETVQPLKDDHVHGLLQRAIDRGEAPSSLDFALAEQVLLGALYWRLVLHRRGLAAAEVGRLAAMLEAAVRTAGLLPER